ncbi:hypothetical protein BO70DRAFT_45081 [Aspergillus heteromorphus CBS 117.55]|uniref:Uncharacterized protein n=1 Tax=Aspergillus heteromorphus CBS 117.55 TaxID=1448321 RepID=A0A317W1K7_9EURO|nr:uncharacterized protein BO70DRAFT_45081 [Aspergillus heteromorphus CBS 117.55]PWY80526.1 hypothetical protein BO70DRAFT_45081 [Aspergillus heteromorphus CBS 117.55]
MKFTSSSVVAAATFFSAANAAGLSLPDIPQSCLQIPQVLGNKPLQLMHYFNTEVCDKNCTATINQHNQYLQEQVVPQITKDLDAKLGISTSQEESFSQFRTQLTSAVTKDCQTEGNKPLCNDLQGLFQYGACVFKATQPIIMNHIGQISSSINITEAGCNKIKELDSDQTVWQKTLPGYIDKFEQLCASEK